MQLAVDWAIPSKSNMGCKNSLKSRILEKNSSCFIAGCNCHLVHLAAGKGGQAYESISSFSCEDHNVISITFFQRQLKKKRNLN